MYQDSLPTLRIDLGNLSLVFRSIKQLTAIKSTTRRKTVTKIPDKAEGFIALSMGLVLVCVVDCKTRLVSILARVNT